MYQHWLARGGARARPVADPVFAHEILYGTRPALCSGDLVRVDDFAGLASGQLGPAVQYVVLFFLCEAPPAPLLVALLDWARELPGALHFSRVANSRESFHARDLKQKKNERKTALA